MVLNLRDLVWTIDPKQDSFEDLLDRLEEYGTELCAAKDIFFKILYNKTIFKNGLSTVVRRQIYLFAKEAINNAVKHSTATVIELSAKEKEAEGNLEITVSDNDSGFDTAMIKAGNGLRNMQKRADEIAAKLILNSKQNEGTSVCLQYKIT